jgi:hypothetical protein
MTLASIAVVALISACGGGKQKKQETAQTRSNGVFEIISYSADSVKFKAVVETKFYSLALVSGEQTVEAQEFSNSVDTVQFAGGSRLYPGSTFLLPVKFNDSNAMTLPAGIVITVFGFSVPENFKAEKIRFITEGTTEMYYDISKSSWLMTEVIESEN